MEGKETKIEPVNEKKEFEMSWPNIIRIDHIFRPELRLDLNKTRPLELNAYETPMLVQMAPIIDGKPGVTKNDHLGFEVLYIYQGVVHKYRPDFLIRLKNGTMLVLETKGQETPQDRTKREFLDEWVKAVNEHGEFGKWGREVSRNPADVAEILYRTSN